jgi:hypothetical protein
MPNQEFRWRRLIYGLFSPQSACWVTDEIRHFFEDDIADLNSCIQFIFIVICFAFPASCSRSLSSSNCFFICASRSAFVCCICIIALVFPTSKTLRPPPWINCCPIMKLTSLKGYLLPIHKSWEKLLILHVHDIQSIFPDKTVMTDFNQTRFTSGTEENQRQNYLNRFGKMGAPKWLSMSEQFIIRRPDNSKL